MDSTLILLDIYCSLLLVLLLFYIIKKRKGTAAVDNSRKGNDPAATAMVQESVVIRNAWRTPTRGRSLRQANTKPPPTNKVAAQLKRKARHSMPPDAISISIGTPMATAKKTNNMPTTKRTGRRSSMSGDLCRQPRRRGASERPLAPPDNRARTPAPRC